jgi:hypothetical protein
MLVANPLCWFCHDAGHLINVMIDTIKTFNNKVLSAPYYMLDTLKTVVAFFVNLRSPVVSTPICFIPEMWVHVFFSKLNNKH